MTATATATAVPQSLVDLLRSRLSPHPHNRKHFDKAQLRELADNIATPGIGILTPILVRPLPDGGYQIIAGERRWRAADIAGMEYVPCLVRGLTDAQALEFLAIENNQRDDVDPLDEADLYQAMVTESGFTPERIADRLGRSETYVRQRIQLLQLTPEARKLFAVDGFTIKHAIELARLRPEDQARAIDGYGVIKDYRGGINPVSDLQAWVRRNVHLDLANAPFSKDDAELVPAAGSCMACPKRTGFTPSLFPELGKKDHCTDATCFKGKVEAHLSQTINEAKASGQGLVKLTVQPNYRDRTVEAGRPIPSNHWHEARKGEKGGVRGIVLDGDGRGHVVSVVLDKAAQAVARLTPEQIKEREAKVAKRKKTKPRAPTIGNRVQRNADHDGKRVFRDMVRSRVRAAVVAAAKGAGVRPEVLAFLFALQLTVMLDDEIQELNQVTGLKLSTRRNQPEARRLYLNTSPEKQRLMLLAAALCQENCWDDEGMAFVAKAYAVDPKKVAADLRTEVERLAKAAPGKKLNPLTAACEVCKCTWENACQGGCSWLPNFWAAGRPVCSNPKCAKKAKPIAVPKPVVLKQKARRRGIPDFMQPVQPSAALSVIVGSTPLPRTELTKKLWSYIKRKKLQDERERRIINCDDALAAVVGKPKLSMFEMTKAINRHVSTVKPAAAKKLVGDVRRAKKAKAKR